MSWKENIAFMCDVEQMFLQFMVCPDQRDFFAIPVVGK